MKQFMVMSASNRLILFFLRPSYARLSTRTSCKSMLKHSETELFHAKRHFSENEKQCLCGKELNSNWDEVPFMWIKYPIAPLCKTCEKIAKKRAKK